MLKKYPFFKLLMLFFVSMATLTACDDEAVGVREVFSRPVKLFQVGDDNAQRVFRFPGSVSAAKQSDMAFEVAGKITDFLVTEGELVPAGTVLAKLDPTTLAAERDRALAERNAAQADFERYEIAFNRQAVTRQQLDLARRNLEVATAGLRQAKKALEDTVLRAPFTGRIARKVVEDYANVQAKQTVLILQTDDALEMKVHVSEADWVRNKRVEDIETIEINSNISVELSTLPGEMFPAKITSFSSMADPITRTFEVTVGFETPQLVSISPGMTGSVIYEMPHDPNKISLLVPTNAVVLAQFSLLLVPESAVLSTADKVPYVWLYDKKTGTVFQRIITLGDPVGNSIHVKAGLERGDIIAVSGVRSLGEGYPVHALKG
ncbi:efflux RND transporter periplasmic adaptor subunit [Photobacterium ganghwense]|uniref:efflux RND transporter periplasmic adaptor subunit n=1 Tax=Photobacterium ganghwense TaxID=320778 RepID=UPI0039EF600E